MSNNAAARQCLRAPISEIFYAAHLLDRAVGAHLANDHSAAADLIAAADISAIRDWTESLWGSARRNPEQRNYLQYRQVPAAPPLLPKEGRIPVRMPTAAERREIVQRYGRNCVFCGIPVIRKEIRCAIQATYPSSLQWGGPNQSQHAAFQCMWLQFDHVLPHSRGGLNSVENIVITCAPCNYGRGDRTLEELGLLDPRHRPVYKTSWDGLERFVDKSEFSSGIKHQSRASRSP